MKCPSLHICLITSGRIFENVIGGEEGYTRLLGKWLNNNGVHVTLMGSTLSGVKSQIFSSTADLGKGDRQNKHTKPKAYYPKYWIYFLSRIFLTLLWVIEIIRTSRRSKYMLIHSQDTGYAGFASIIAGKLLRIPTVISSHGVRHKALESIINGPFRSILLKIEYRIDIFTVSKADQVVAINPNIKSYYEGLTKRNIDYFPNPIDTNKFKFSESDRQSAREEFGVSPNEIVLCYIGRFSPEKNLFTLIDSFAKCVNSDFSIKLLLVGNGIIEEDLKNRVNQLKNIKGITFCGIRNDVSRLLSCCDIFVLPSFIEGMSTSLLEAMACGRPIICSNIPSNTLLVTSENAILIDPHNSENLESAIRELVKNSKRRSEMGIKSRENVLKFDQDEVFSNLKCYYEEIIRGKLK